MHATRVAIPVHDAHMRSRKSFGLRHSDFLCHSSFGFVILVIRVIRRSKAYHRLPFWLFAAPTHEQLCPVLPETRPSSQIDPAFLADSSKRQIGRASCRERVEV